MAILAFESFVGDDANPIGGNLTTMPGFGDFERFSNTARGVEFGSNATYWNAITPPDDCYVEVEWDDINAGAGGMFVRGATDGSAFLYAHFEASTLTLYEFSAGDFHPFTGTSFSPTPGELLRLIIAGTRLSVNASGVEILTADTDGTITGGVFGLRAFYNPSFRSFEGGSLGAAFKTAWASQANGRVQ